MKRIILFIAVWACHSVIGKCVESEYGAQIFHGVSRKDNAITNVVFNVLSEDGKSFLSLAPNVQSCIKRTESGEIHFVDLDCGIHLRRDVLTGGMESLKRYVFGTVRCWRIGNDQEGEALYCGAGRIKFDVDDMFRAWADAAQKAQMVADAEWSTGYRKEKCFLSSGVRRLLAYCESGTLRTYLKNAFNPDKWLVLSYVLLVETGRDVERSQKLSFGYDISHVDGNRISSVRKGVLPILVKDKSTSRADGVRIAMAESTEWNYDLDVEFEGVGCQIRVFQHDINEAVTYWHCP